jgi:hypothetical protein
LLTIVHRAAEAAGPPSGERAQRLAQIDEIFSGDPAPQLPEEAPRQIAASAPAAPPTAKSKVKARQPPK